MKKRGITIQKRLNTTGILDYYLITLFSIFDLSGSARIYYRELNSKLGILFIANTLHVLSSEGDAHLQHNNMIKYRVCTNQNLSFHREGTYGVSAQRCAMYYELSGRHKN
jgi:hypothetical protein